MDKQLVRKVIFPLHERLRHRKTFEYLEELESLQYAPPKDLEEIRFRKLRELLLHAQSDIPFYAEYFAKAGFDPAKMQEIDDFKVLPLLNKAEIRQNLDRMQWKDSPGGLTRYNTGGSSGEPLVFYYDRRRQGYDIAARAMTHRWWGIDIGDRELYLWGSPLEITKQDKLKDLRDMLTNQLLISAFEISPQKVSDMTNQFRKFKPDCVFGYPSTIALFCQMAEQEKLHLDDVGVQVIFSAAEVLYDHQRESIGKFFGGKPVVDSYGSREGGFISHECREGVYHVMDPNYILEYIKEDGMPALPGEDGEIVITHLDAYGMPFIRYRTGDVSQPGIGKCNCGRTFSTMSKIQGRTTDFIVTPDGRRQHALSIIYVVRDIEGVAKFKIIQEKTDDVRVLIKIHENLYPADGNERIVRGFKKRMGDEVRVTVEQVDEIPREASGKYRYVVSKVTP